MSTSGGVEVGGAATTPRGAYDLHGRTSVTRKGVPTRVSRAFVFWIVLGALGNIPWGGVEQALPQLILGLIGMSHAVASYWSDGGRRISAPGVYMIGSGLFVYFPALYLWFDDPMIHGAVDYVAAVNLAYWTQIALYFMFWHPRPLRNVEVQQTSEPRVTTWGMLAGAVLLITGVLLVDTPLAPYGFDDGAAFAGLALFAVASFRRARVITLFTYVLIALGFVIYMQFVFAGFGRLQVGALGIALAAAAAHRWPGRLVKLALLLSFPPVMAYLAASRVKFTGSMNPDQSASVTGLESALAPFVRFAELLALNAAGLIEHSWFHTFFASAVALVPRAVWPTKPIGFGAELGNFFRPDLVGRGHSEAALFHGEWLYAFGLVALVALVPILGVSVRWLDDTVQGRTVTRSLTRGDVLRITALLVMAASLTDLIWGGSFTYVSRVGPRLLCLGAAYMAFGWRAPAARPSESLLSPANSSSRAEMRRA